MDLDYLYSVAPYSLSAKDKHKVLTGILKELTVKHYKNCPEYAKLLDVFDFNSDQISSYYYIPFLPVRLFKLFDLMSIKKEDVFKTMMSSGTTGGLASKIFLDKNKADSQQKVLSKMFNAIFCLKVSHLSI